jgi:hypothetical protein
MKFAKKNASRSEEVRNRRTYPLPGAKKSSGKRTVRIDSPKPPPVLVRKPLAGISRPAPKNSSKKRKYLNLSKDPAYKTEIGLPAIQGLSLSWRLVSFLMVAILGAALYLFWQSPSLRIDAPNIEGLKHITSNQVVSELSLIGQPIFLLDAASLENELLRKFPEFSSADVQIQFPNKVNIAVTERVPVLIWNQGGESALVDLQGVTFPNRGAGDPGLLPVIDASGDPVNVGGPEIPESNLREQTIQKITGALMPTLLVEDQVKPLLSPEMVNSILIIAQQSPDGSKLIYDPIHGFGWTDRRGWNVFLGDSNEMETKIHIYRAIMDDLKKQEQQPTLISVEYAYAPYYRVNEE